MKAIPDPLTERLRCWLARWVICPLAGHRPIQKMDGTVLCRRHD